MFTSESSKEVTLLCENELMRVIIDHYGEDAAVDRYDEMCIRDSWCMEHDLMGEKFLEEHGDVVNQVKACLLYTSRCV